MPSHCLVALALLATSPDSTVPLLSHDGVISGVVVNGSQQERPVAGAPVVLQLKSDQEFAVLDETQTDAAGRFYFHHLLVSQHIQYKTGSQHAGIHYPGPRIVLTPDQKHVGARIEVRDTIHHPNPLVVRQHVVLVESETGLLRVTESMIIENPTDCAYVGTGVDDQDEPETLQLSIPREFLKVTFHKAFYGRAFAVKNDRLVTSLPWEPGRRELTFTYVLPNDQKYQIWQRPLDLPTDNMSVRIAAGAPEEVACRVNGAALARRDETPGLVFESHGSPLQKGQVVRVELGQLPISWMVYGRWSAALVLAFAFVAAIFIRVRRPGFSRPAAPTAAEPSAASKPTDKNALRRKQRPHRQRRRAA